MIVRSLDPNNDWVFGNGKGAYLTFNNAIAQSIQTQLSTFLGECFFNVTVGVDWWNLLGYKNLDAISLQCSTIILNSFGVTGVKRLDFKLDSITRNLQVIYDVLTIYPGNVTGNFFILTDEQGNRLTDEFGNVLLA